MVALANKKGDLNSKMGQPDVIMEELVPRVLVVSLLEQNAEDSSEQVHKRIQEAASAKVFPVIVICSGCKSERINPDL
jgi:hypothetical protein